METAILYKAYIWVVYGSYWGNTRIMHKKMEFTILYRAL